MRSQQRAAAAWADNRFAKTVVPVRDINGMTVLAHDETVRGNTTVESLSSLKPSFEQMGLMGFDATALRK